MKLGEIHPSKYQRCIICNRVIMNKQHNRYYKYYNEDKYDIKDAVKKTMKNSKY